MKAIICDYHPWDTDFRVGDHHYARLFIDNGWDVLWISHPVSPFHGMKPENADRIQRAKSGPHRHANGPIEYIPFTVIPFLKAPVLSSQWALENTHKYFNPSLEVTLRKTGFDKPDLVWITDAALHAVMTAADAKVRAVRIADDNTEFRSMPRALKTIEERLMKQANVVFVTSSPLESRLKTKFGGKLHLLRNGVEYEHFQGEFEKPDEYRFIDGPIAVYVGAIDEWFAPDWVTTLAKLRDDITSVIIGHSKINLSELMHIPNVRILGPKQYREIPAYLAHAELGIIPFRRTKLVDSISPLKLFEFFAAGLPVVSTRWKELEWLDSPALLAADADDFARLVWRAVDEGWKKQQGAHFRKYAAQNSWQSRYESAMSVLERYLGD